MPSAKLTSRGQVTVPKAIRDLLRLGTGDRTLRGFLHRKGLKPLSVEQMNAIIRRRAASSNSSP